jgi:peptidoglycan hydrolase-like protein with peptidoglycan-binding domain
MRTARRHIASLRPRDGNGEADGAHLSPRLPAIAATGTAASPPGAAPPRSAPAAGENGGAGLSERTVHRGGRLPGIGQARLLHGSAARARAQRERGGSPRRVLLIAAAAIVALLVAAGLALVLAGAGISAGGQALAQIGLPLGGGTVTSVKVLEGPHSSAVPIALRGNQVWPRGQLPVGRRVVVEALVQRPGWIAWLTGKRERIVRTLVTPSAQLRQQDFTLAPGAPLQLSFTSPVAVISYGAVTGSLRRRVIAPASEATLPRTGAAGSLLVAAAPRTWERAPAVTVSWFPPGVSSAAVASPAPGSQIGPETPLTLTFSRSASAALHGALPVLTPGTSGGWRREGERTLVFQPSGYGYGLGSQVRVALPAGVRLLGAPGTGGAAAQWRVPGGSTLRLQQLLAQLGYLPLRVSGAAASVAATPQAQVQAAVSPPPGSFSWRYGDVPAALRSFWSPGTFGVVTKGAVMAFESEHEMTADGIPGAAVWRALIGAAMAHRVNTSGYTFVSVSKSAQTLSLWHDGRTVLTTPVNTGISSAPTEAGTFPVFEHIRSGTMSGTNPDGSHYEDPGVPYISYFNGGDALHGFERAQYGFPQSLGCVEMPPSTAGRVWPYTPVGTLVHVAE